MRNLNKIKLFLDFDNTLVATNEVLVEYFNKKYGTNKCVDHIKKYYYQDLFPNIPREEISNFFNSNYLFDNLYFLEDSYNILYKLKDMLSISIVTISGNKNAHKKKNWLLNNFNIPHKLFCIDNEKNDKSSVDMSNAIFIDDNISCLRSSNAKIKILYRHGYDGDWNKYDNLDEVYVVENWQEIFDIINFFIRNGEVF